MNKLDNIVIELLDRKHGQKVKKLFQRNGEKLINWGFDSTKESGFSRYRFYGYRNGKFDNYNQLTIKMSNLKVLTLEEATKLLDSEPDFIFEF